MRPDESFQSLQDLFRAAEAAGLTAPPTLNESADLLQLSLALEDPGVATAEHQADIYRFGKTSAFFRHLPLWSVYWKLQQHVARHPELVPWLQWTVKTSYNDPAFIPTPAPKSVDRSTACNSVVLTDILCHILSQPNLDSIQRRSLTLAELDLPAPVPPPEGLLSACRQVRRWNTLCPENLKSIGEN